MEPIDGGLPSTLSRTAPDRARLEVARLVGKARSFRMTGQQIPAHCIRISTAGRLDQLTAAFPDSESGPNAYAAHLQLARVLFLEATLW